MSKGAVGAALGVAGTTAYLRPDIVIEWVRKAEGNSSGFNGSKADGAQVEQLAKMVEQLTKEIRSNNTVTILHPPPSSSDSASLRTIALTTTAALSAGAIYFIFIRGWRLSDLSWVTQSTFRRGMSHLSAGLDALSTRLADVKSRLAARMADIARKQDEAATAAAAMRAHLADVGADVEGVRSQVNQVHTVVMDMDAALTDISTNQRHSMHGIYILCKAVGELAAGSTIPSKDALLEYTQSPLWQRGVGGGAGVGLEGILQPSTPMPAAVNEEVWPRRRFMLYNTTTNTAARTAVMSQYQEEQHTGGGGGGVMAKPLPRDNTTTATATTMGGSSFASVPRRQSYYDDGSSGLHYHPHPHPQHPQYQHPANATSSSPLYQHPSNISNSNTARYGGRDWK